MWTAALGNGKEHWTWGIATLGMCSKAAMGWNNYELGSAKGEVHQLKQKGCSTGLGQQDRGISAVLHESSSTGLLKVKMNWVN